MSAGGFKCAVCLLIGKLPIGKLLDSMCMVCAYEVCVSVSLSVSRVSVLASQLATVCTRLSRRVRTALTHLLYTFALP